jgi:type 2 lantibiotic biosynthesis protein LanM
MSDPRTGDLDNGHPDSDASIGGPAPAELTPLLDRLIVPALTDLDHRLGRTALQHAERQAVRQGTAAALRPEVWRRVSRVLILELNAARVTGRLTAGTPEERWREWLESTATPDYWESLTERYPTLLPRLSRLIGNRCAAAAEMAARFADDRDAVAALSGADPRLTGLVTGEGDSHRGGRTVMTLELAGGRVIYKPRPLDVDRALGQFLSALLPDEADATRIRTPEVVCRPDYGWAAHVPHRYCIDEDELRTYYRGLGHWLAVTRLLSASDLHSGNVVAAGPVPVVVDCETLFTPDDPAPASGFGSAFDRAAHLVSGSLLRTGLLPMRGQSLALRGADISAAGALPSQQPQVQIPTIVGVGTDEARLDHTLVPVQELANLPSPEPALERHWPAVLDGFSALTAHLQALDRSGRLEPLLAPFRHCRIRAVTRDTVVYTELIRMLWHPVSLHREARAKRRVIDVLIKHGMRSPLATTDPSVIDAEVADLLVADVPLFETTAGHGTFTGPQGVTMGDPRDLVHTALQRWRSLDPDIDLLVTRSAVVSAYLNDSGPSIVIDERTGRQESRYLPTAPTDADPADPRRRTLAADVMRRIIDGALRADDGTVTWIAPVLDSTAWQIRPLSPDIYSGVPGVAVTLAAYRAEASAGRADPVPEVEPLLHETVQTLRVYEDETARRRQAGPTPRPEPPGGFVGLGSRIWSWLLLARFGAVGHDEAVQRSRVLADLIPESVSIDEVFDLLYGTSGAIVPLLRLSEHTGEERYREMAAQIADLLGARAQPGPSGTRWLSDLAPNGLGGLGHGVSGIGWALDRLATATGTPRFGALASAAIRYEESLYAPDLDGWRDLRKAHDTSPWWCHGAAGIGIMAADLWRERGDPRHHDMLRRAAALCWRDGFGVTHTLCHGDLGTWEVLSVALEAGAAPGHLDRATLDGHVLSSLAEHGPHSNATVDVFVPGLMHGLGGVVYQLLRMHPDSRLPSVLLPDPGPAAHTT